MTKKIDSQELSKALRENAKRRRSLKSSQESLDCSSPALAPQKQKERKIVK